MNPLYSSTALSNTKLGSFLLKGPDVQEISLPRIIGLRCPDMRLQMNELTGAGEDEIQLNRTPGGFLSKSDVTTSTTLRILLTNPAFPKVQFLPFIGHSQCAATREFIDGIVEEDIAPQYRGIVNLASRSAIEEGYNLVTEQTIAQFADEVVKLSILHSMSNATGISINGKLLIETLIDDGTQVVPMFCELADKAKDYKLQVYDPVSAAFVRSEDFAKRIGDGSESSFAELGSRQKAEAIMDALDAGIRNYQERIASGSYLQR